MRVGQDKRQGSHWGSDEEMAEMKMACTKAVAMQVGRSGQAGEHQGVKPTQCESLVRTPEFIVRRNTLGMEGMVG